MYGVWGQLLDEEGVFGCSCWETRRYIFMEASLTTDVTDEVRLNLASRQRQRSGGRGKRCSLAFSVIPLQKAKKRMQRKPWVSSAHASTVMN